MILKRTAWLGRSVVSHVQLVSRYLHRNPSQHASNDDDSETLALEEVRQSLAWTMTDHLMKNQGSCAEMQLVCCLKTDEMQVNPSSESVCWKMSGQSVKTLQHCFGAKADQQRNEPCDEALIVSEQVETP